MPRCEEKIMGREFLVIRVYEIWHGELLDTVRRLHREGRFKEFAVCKKCYLPRATEESEHAFVNDREIVIKNYINRKQVIGE